MTKEEFDEAWRCGCSGCRRKVVSFITELGNANDMLLGASRSPADIRRIRELEQENEELTNLVANLNKGRKQREYGARASA